METVDRSYQIKALTSLNDVDGLIMSTKKVLIKNHD
jgi:hypothetical protein